MFDRINKCRAVFILEDPLESARKIECERVVDDNRSREDERDRLIVAIDRLQVLRHLLHNLQSG